jgi:hypothetical protein
VPRTGSTKGWASPANAIASDDAYAQSGTYLPGDKSELLRIQIDAPSPPLGSLPAILQVEVELQMDPDTGLGTVVADDDVRLGTLAGGPAGTQKAITSAIPYNDTVWTYHVPTDGITLADLNAGAACLFLGYKAIPETPVNPADWNVAVSGVGASVTDGAIDGSTPWAGSGPWAYDSGNSGPVPSTGYSAGDATVTATYIGAGTAPAYVPLSTTVNLNAGGAAVVSFPNNSLIDYVIDDGQGTSQSGTNVTSAKTSTTTVFRNNAVAGGVASQVLSVRAQSSVYGSVPAASARATGSVQVTGAIVNPDPSTMKIDSVSISYDDVLVSGGGREHPMAGPMAHQYGMGGFAIR